jgi:hypothetical protein
MAEKLTICLVGPKNGGKSSLLASLADCVIQSAYGYSPDLRPALQAITQNEFEKAEAAASKFEILESLVSPYERLRQEFAGGGAPTSPADIYEYYFRLTLNGEAPLEARAKAPYLLEIVDASGDIAAPDEASPIVVPYGIREKFAAKLLSAEAIVFVLPLVRFDDCRWVGALARLMERLAQTPDKKAKRLIVAFSQYERLFVQLGPSAFTHACDPAVALHVLRKSVQAAPWMDVLRTLEAAADDVRVRFTVFSAYGFTKTFQNPNIDPHQMGEWRFHRSSVNGPHALSEFWRPFLTVEPILCAALDLDSAFTFSYAQIDGSEPALVAEDETRSADEG